MLSSALFVSAHPNERWVARQVLRLVYYDVERAPHPLRRILLLVLLQRTQQESSE